ncbi:CoA transferase (plasmid) [Mycolicibacterium madagascariense]|uniref:CoA transferase n=1 Tax=Mycolicibacterium madagascariense TaxID=212765 RepID=A0A7I7XPU4_9MYCO|nr:CoA transferase [Mycolicibacterium madagascariense]
MNDVSDPAHGNGGALAGLRVVDLSRVLAGPYAAQMLGDHGAHVIKVEPPAGDATRQWGEASQDGVTPYYAGLNRNKQHVSVDLSTAAGRAVVLTLLDGADVLIENFLAGTMERWDLAPEWLLEQFPRLVYCRISAFGVTGPMAGLPGYDAVLQAYSGLMHLNGEPGGPPVRIPMPVVDLTTAMLAFSGVLLALNERHVSGCGQLVDVSLLDAALSLQHPAAANYFATGVPPKRLGSGHPNISPCTVLDGGGDYLYVSAGTDRQFAQLCSYLGIANLTQDTRFATNQARLVNDAELRALLSARLEALTITADTAREMISLGIPASLVRPLENVLTDPQVAERDMAPTVGDVTVLGIPVRLSRTPGSVRTPPRSQGADNGAILRDLGLSDDVITSLEHSGTVRAPVGRGSTTAPSDSTDCHLPGEAHALPQKHH